MRYFQIALFCIICNAKSYGQTGTRGYGKVHVEVTKEKRSKRIFTKVEITGALPKGDSSVTQSLEQELNQSLRFNKAKAGKYLILVRFLLERDGSVTDIHCLNDSGLKICKQVEAAIKKVFGYHWYPQTRTSKD